MKTNTCLSNNEKKKWQKLNKKKLISIQALQKKGGKTSGKKTIKKKSQTKFKYLSKLYYVRSRRKFQHF